MTRFVVEGSLLFFSACLWLVLVVLACGGCAPTTAYVAARRVESGAADSLRIAYVAWRTADANHQDALLAAAPTWPDYEKAVTVWRKGPQTEVDKAFMTARDAVGTLDAALGMRDAISRVDFSLLESQVIAAFTALAAILTRYGVKVPLPSSPTAMWLWHPLGWLPDRAYADAAGDAYECSGHAACRAVVWPDDINTTIGAAA